MKNLHMTREQAEAHQRKHGFPNPALAAKQAREIMGGAEFISETKRLVRNTHKMTRPEREYSLILAAKKRAGEILDYRYEGIRLKWGVDSDTGDAMWYKPDFVVIVSEYKTRREVAFTLIEVKGPWISERDLVRFKGCRAAWPQFQFEMHQRDREGRWTRIQ
jgi:hypothetical protein